MFKFVSSLLILATASTQAGTLRCETYGFDAYRYVSPTYSSHTTDVTVQNGHTLATASLNSSYTETNEVVVTVKNESGVNLGGVFTTWSCYDPKSANLQHCYVSPANVSKLAVSSVSIGSHQSTSLTLPLPQGRKHQVGVIWSPYVLDSVPGYSGVSPKIRVTNIAIQTQHDYTKKYLDWPFAPTLQSADEWNFANLSYKDALDVGDNDMLYMNHGGVSNINNMAFTLYSTSGDDVGVKMKSVGITDSKLLSKGVPFTPTHLASMYFALSIAEAATPGVKSASVSVRRTCP